MLCPDSPSDPLQGGKKAGEGSEEVLPLLPERNRLLHEVPGFTFIVGQSSHLPSGDIHSWILYSEADERT